MCKGMTNHARKWCEMPEMLYTFLCEVPFAFGTMCEYSEG